MEKKIEKTKNEQMNIDTNTAAEDDKIIPPEKFDGLFEQARGILMMFGKQEIKKETPMSAILLRLEN